MSDNGSQGGGKKRNRNRNKNKNKKQGNQGGQNGEGVPTPVAQVPPPNLQETPLKEKSPPRVKEPNKTREEKLGTDAKAKIQESKSTVTMTEEMRHQELLKNMKKDFVIPNFVELQDAERKYAKKMALEYEKKSKKSNKSSHDSDFDLFASDEEDNDKKVVLAKPRFAKQTPKTGKSLKNVESIEENDEGYQSNSKSALSAEIAKARQHIKNSLECVDGIAAMAGSPNQELVNRVKKLENENKNLKKVTDDLKKLVISLESRLDQVEKSGSGSKAAPPSKANQSKDEDEDEDVDLFASGSDDEEEDAEKARVREERLKAYAEKKAKKPALIAKTSVLLDIKPWDDETDMDAMLKACKTIEKEGLVWGASKLVPVGYGINKLQLMCVVEDEKVSIDELSEQIQEFEDYVQSVDIAAMSKI